MNLVDLLREDGVTLKGSGPERSARCPFHEDKTPSLSVNVEKGLYNCHACGASGDAVTYLVRKRGMSKREALDAVNGTAHPPPPRPEPRPPAEPKFFSGLPKSIARHPYQNADGSLAFVVCRFAGGPKCLPYTPALKLGRKGWIQALPMTENRPLYRLPELLGADKKRQVMVVEGEKCADAAAEAFPSAVVTTWSMGCKSYKKTDWKPLDGRKVLVVSDADAEGRKAAQSIARLFEGRCPEIRIVLPKGEDHSDIVDIIEQAGAGKARAWLKSLAAPYRSPKKISSCSAALRFRAGQRAFHGPGKRARPGGLETPYPSDPFLSAHLAGPAIHADFIGRSQVAVEGAQGPRPVSFSVPPVGVGDFKEGGPDGAN